MARLRPHHEAGEWYRAADPLSAGAESQSGWTLIQAIKASQAPEIQYFFVAAALVFAALAVHLTYRRIVVLRSGGVAKGQITDHDRREIDESVGYHPTVSFVDHSGKERRFTSSSGWNRPKPSVGTAVAVVYLRSNPERAYISSVFHLWAGPVAMLVLALAAVAGAVKVSA